METRASYIFVGSFVVALLAGLFAFLIWIAKIQFGETSDVYLVYLTGSVTGLQEGSSVRYRGIPIGTVTDIRLDPKDVTRVRATLEVKDGTPIKSDSIASLEVQGLTGGAYIQISGGTEDSPPLTDPDGGTPIIPSRPSSLAEVVNTAPELLAKMIALVDRVSGMVTPENREAVSATLANTRRMTETLADASADVAKTLKTVNTLAATINDRTAPRLDETLTEARATLVALQSSIKTLTEAATETAKSLRTTSDRFGTLAADNRQAIRDFTSTGLYDATQLVNQLRELSDRLSRFITRLDNDPSSVLFGGTRQGLQMQGK